MGSSYFILKLYRKIKECNFNDVLTSDLFQKIKSSDGFLGSAEELSFSNKEHLESSETQSYEGENAFLALYFQTQEQREAARVLLEKTSPHFEIQTDEIAFEDWTTSWQKSFSRIELCGSWKILPAWEEPVAKSTRIDPGMGFGTGDHPTTRLCLERLLELQDEVAESSFLDFGSGSGVLSILAAQLGAKSIYAVEIDDDARENAKRNFALNRVEGQIIQVSNLDSVRFEDFDFIVANVLRNVLLDFRAELLQRLGRKAHILLSGLLSHQSREVLEAYRLGLAERYKTSSEIEAQGWSLIDIESL